MDLDLRDLELLDVLADHGTLVASATVLHVSQPALSQRLTKMEQRLGTQLFDREGRRLVPNVAGRRMLVAARHVLRELRSAEQDVAEIRSGQDRQIRFAAQCTTALQWLPDVLRSFHTVHPDAEVRITAVTGDEPIPALLDDLIDVALVTKHDSRMDKLDLITLFEDELVAVVGRAHPWAQRSHVTARDFSDVDLILYDVYDQTKIPTPDLPLPPGARPRRITFTPVVTELVVEMVSSSDGVAILPSWVVAPYVRTRGLALVRIGTRANRRTWYCATRPGPQPERVSTFVGEIVAHLGSPEWREGVRLGRTG
jgi:LysR family transcriptional regulator, regulator for metE and metH